LSSISPIGDVRQWSTHPTYLDSAIYAGLSIALSYVAEDQMLKIQRKANGEVVLTLSGRLDAGSLSELATVLDAEPTGRAVVLDLKDVVLVDRDTVRFLRTRERDGIALRNCPPYIRAWIEREEASHNGSGATNDAAIRIDD
jgi:hypothetical protein